VGWRRPHHLDSVLHCKKSPRRHERATLFHSGVATLALLGHSQWMTATLDEIHSDPAILDRAISSGERLDILANGRVAATLLPQPPPIADAARRVMKMRFGAPDWEFIPGVPMNRDERNARG